MNDHHSGEVHETQYIASQEAVADEHITGDTEDVEMSDFELGLPEDTWELRKARVISGDDIRAVDELFVRDEEIDNDETFPYVRPQAVNESLVRNRVIEFLEATSLDPEYDGDITWAKSASSEEITKYWWELQQALSKPEE